MDVSRWERSPTPRLGRYDEANPLIVGEIHKRIQGSAWVIFERSSHMPYVEEPEAFLDTVESFLRKVRLKTGLGAR